MSLVECSQEGKTYMLITPEMVQMAHERVAEKEQDTRVKLSDVRKAYMKERGLSFPVPANPLTVILVDDFMHTVAIPTCDDPGCICYALERDLAAQELHKVKRPRRQRKVMSSGYQNECNTAALNGNLPFQFMR